MTLSPMLVTVSPSRQAALADAYRALPTEATSPLVTYAWRVFAEETMRQLDGMIAAGITVETSDVDPYAGPADMMRDVREHGRMRVLATRVTGSHPLLTDDANDAFRAVHDYYGHAGTGRGFDRHGEDAAYLAHRRMYRSPLARLALTTETRGQNAALINSVDGATFDVQRIGFLPARWSAVDALRPLAHEASDAFVQAIAFHRNAGLTAPTHVR